MRKTKTYYNEKELPLIMTTFEVSMLLRCSEEYVRRIAHEGRISFQKNGKNMVEIFVLFPLQRKLGR